MATLRAKVAETENSLWYNAGRHQGKFAGAGAGPLPPPSGTRFCKSCNSTPHWEFGTVQNGVELMILNKQKLLEKNQKKTKKKKRGKKKTKKVDQPNGAGAAVETLESSGSGS